MTNKTRGARLVIPRRTFLGTTAAFVGLAAPSGMNAYAAGEGGESGEGAALEGLSPDVSFLTILGQFEATHRIVAGLVANDDPATAKLHLEQSHHAFYEDIAEGLTERGDPSFEAQADQFAEAIESGADNATTTELADTVIGIIHRTVHGSKPADVMAAARQLVLIAAGDFEGGVEDGMVVEPQEYRDAWGFANVAEAWLAVVADHADTKVAAAGDAAVRAMQPTAALFDGLDATETDGDASVLYGAAARIEIAALRLD